MKEYGLHRQVIQMTTKTRRRSLLPLAKRKTQNKIDGTARQYCVGLSNFLVTLSSLTVLSATYSNLENHPRLIRARDANPVVKIRLDPRTGFPMVEELPPRLRGKAAKQPPIEDDEDKDAARMDSTQIRTSDVTDFSLAVHYTVTRLKDETPEEKKARKAAVKAEKQVRRADKKATKEQFAAEFKAQKRTINNKEKASVRKL